MTTPSWEQLSEAVKLWSEGRPWSEVQEAMVEALDELMIPAISEASQTVSHRRAS